MVPHVGSAYKCAGSIRHCHGWRARLPSTLSPSQALKWQSGRASPLGAYRLQDKAHTPYSIFSEPLCSEPCPGSISPSRVNSLRICPGETFSPNGRAHDVTVSQAKGRAHDPGSANWAHSLRTWPL